MITLPSQTDIRFQVMLLTAIANRGGIAVAEELRPAVERNLTLKIVSEQEKEWRDRVSWALIEMGPITKKGNGKEWLSYPFGKPGEERLKERNQWIRNHRPGCKPQQVWEISPKGWERLRQESFESIEQIADLSREEEQANYFESQSFNEAREHVLRSIVRRRGQPQFRQKLLDTYQRCIISGCDAEDALEAAHIRTYATGGTNHLSNGLLLRADLHTLFDLGLISIEPEAMVILIAPILMNTCYQEFDGKALLLPKGTENIPDKKALKEHSRAIRQSMLWK